MTLPELSQTLAAPLQPTDTQIGLSFVNDATIMKYPYPQQEVTAATEIRAYLMDCDLTGELLAADTATLLVFLNHVGYTDTLTISTLDDASITAAVDALISAP